jgi:hypothetical protein
MGQRIFFVGAPVAIERGHSTIDQFLDVMAFSTEADRSNAVAAALTVMLRNFWEGAKPLIAVTASKSHAGKDTIIDFAAGRTPHASLSHESVDWAFQKNFASLVHNDPTLGLVNVESVRADGRDAKIQSAFLERLLTLTLHKSGIA